MYEAFRDFQKNIGHTSNEIEQNWKNLQYIPWHVDRKPVPTYARVESNEEEQHPNPQRKIGKHEWEIICGLYKNQFINYNEFEMLGHRDLDRMNDWNNAFVDEETFSLAIHFISDMRKLKNIYTNQHAKSLSQLIVWGISKEYHTILSLSIIERVLIHYA